MQGLPAFFASCAVFAAAAHLTSAAAATPNPASTPPSFAKDNTGNAIDGQVVAQPARPKRQIVAIIPDRTTGRDWGLRYLRESVEDFNRTSPDAVFSVGDLVQGYSRDHEHVRGERQTFLDIVGTLEMPFYPTPGNHDLVSGKRDASDRSFAEQYRAMFGPLYYAVELELASFVILNTEDGDGRIEPGFSDAQLAWLDTTLARLETRERPIIILFHRPLWDHKPTRWDERVQPLLVKHGVDYVIAGHYHALCALPPRDGIPYLLLGTCGGANDQHPLAGHLQHTTYLVIEENGTIDPYHQIAGSTLPVDWVTKSDQDAAYGLKSARNAVTIRGAVEDPLGKPVEGEIECTLRNPIDREVEFAFYKTRAPEPWRVTDRITEGGKEVDIERVWTSRTPIDNFNASTTDLNSPFQLELPTEVIRLAPNETRSVRIPVSAAAQVEPRMPAPFDVVATFVDGKSRRVPIVLRQRVPIARTIALGNSLEAATSYPVCVWNWTEYDTGEPSARLRFARTDASALSVRIDATDQRLAPDAKPGSTKSRLDDPLGDGVRVTLGEGAEGREYLVTFDASTNAPVVETLAADGKRLGKADLVSATFLNTPTGWSLTLDLSPAALPEGIRLEDLTLNVGVADNDETYHTQWRWLAPRNAPARLRASAPSTGS
jgi:3',5'-cyclic AMP phosphodiesterase CpdA